MNRALKLLVSAIVCAFLTSVTVSSMADGGTPFQACKDLFPGQVIPDGGLDSGHNTTVALCKTAKDTDFAPIFAALFNTTTKVPVWTAHRLSPDQLKTIRTHPAFASREDFFDEDPDVPKAEQARIANYVRSGYDKGHLVRALDLNWSVDAYKTSYVMTNMAPQAPNLNRGAWLGLEDQFQSWVEDKNTTLWAFAGSWGQNSSPAHLQGDANNTVVPACFYKVVVAQNGEGKLKVLSAVFPNALPNRKRMVWVNYLSSLEIIEQRTGVDFLKGLPQEMSFDAQFWGVDAPDKPADCS